MKQAAAWFGEWGLRRRAVDNGRKERTRARGGRAEGATNAKSSASETEFFHPFLAATSLTLSLSLSPSLFFVTLFPSFSLFLSQARTSLSVFLSSLPFLSILPGHETNCPHPLAMDTAARWVPPPGAEEAGQSTSASTAAAAAQQHHRLCFPNTLAGGAKVPFVPLKTGRVTWYACGPTVYDSAHMVRKRETKKREGEKEKKRRISVDCNRLIDFAQTSTTFLKTEKKTPGPRPGLCLLRHRPPRPRGLVQLGCPSGDERHGRRRQDHLEGEEEGRPRELLEERPR